MQAATSYMDPAGPCPANMALLPWFCKAVEYRSMLGCAGEHLNHLTSLTVAAASICITLPAALRLKRLCICARSKLCLRFESAEETASHLQTFDISFRQLLHGRHMEALQVRLAGSAEDRLHLCVEVLMGSLRLLASMHCAQHLGCSLAHVFWNYLFIVSPACACLTTKIEKRIPGMLPCK